MPALPSRIWRKGAALLTVLIGVGLFAASVANAAGTGKPIRRALILGGGGPVGEAWESGVIARLMQKGVDVYGADKIIGTSAGAIVGARVALGMPPPDLLKAALAEFRSPPPSPERPPPPPDFSFLVSELEEMNKGEAPAQSIEAKIGAWARAAHPIVSEAEFVASFRRRFPKEEWPSRAYECVSVDAADGSLRVWDRSSDISPALAVASSCALPGLFLPVAIRGREYMDGGMRSATNADLARGCLSAIVLAPTIGPKDGLAKVTVDPLNRELRVLRDSGCKVELVVPDAASMKAFGGTLGDSSRAGAAMEAGRSEGSARADETAKLWQQDSRR